MPRPPRYQLAGIPQQIIQTGNNQQPTFFGDADYDFYLECLKDAATTHQCDVHAYALMDRSIHLLLTPHHPDGVGNLMKSLSGRYTRYVNATYHRTGTLWEGRYRAGLVDPDNYLLACYRFIELNPVLAKIAERMGDHRWSSYRWHAFGERNDIVTDHPVYLALGATTQERQTAYRTLSSFQLNERLEREIRHTVYQHFVLGSERFKDKIEATLSRSVRPRKRGRKPNPINVESTEA